MNTSEKGQDAIKGNRLYWLDNLRTSMIFLVILCHAGGVYESSGVWASFWIVDDPSTNNLSGLLNLILDIFMMPTVFFVSGYLAPASLRSKTTWTFVKARFSRLMLPWIIAAVMLLPLYKIIVCNNYFPFPFFIRQILKMFDCFCNR